MCMQTVAMHTAESIPQMLLFELLAMHTKELVWEGRIIFSETYLKDLSRPVWAPLWFEQ